MVTNVYHEILLPVHVDKKFLDVECLTNEVEVKELRKNSQLFKEYVVALPDAKELDLNNKIELIKLFVDKLQLIENGCGVIIDIHKPNKEEVNWYGKILVTTRRFNKESTGLGEKTRDLNLQVKKGKGKAFVQVGEGERTGEIWKEVQNDYFKKLGLSLRVDEISTESKGHIGLRKYGILAEQKRLSKHKFK